MQGMAARCDGYHVPLTIAEFVEFLPGAGGLTALRDLVRPSTNEERNWQLRLLLKVRDVPKVKLDGRSRLGWTSWLGGWRAIAGDVVPRGSRAAVV
jgi:predicted component of type VI protein secretion system